MPRLYADANNRILRYLRTDDDERMFPDAPPGTVHTLEFDEDTNALTAGDLARSTDAYRLSGSTLTRDGQPVVIAADGEDATVRKQAAQTVSDLTAYIGKAAPTGADNINALKTLARAVRYLIRREFGLT